MKESSREIEETGLVVTCKLPVVTVTWKILTMERVGEASVDLSGIRDENSEKPPIAETVSYIQNWIF